MALKNAKTFACICSSDMMLWLKCSKGSYCCLLYHFLAHNFKRNRRKITTERCPMLTHGIRCHHRQLLSSPQFSKAKGRPCNTLSSIRIALGTKGLQDPFPCWPQNLYGISWVSTMKCHAFEVITALTNALTRLRSATSETVMKKNQLCAVIE